MLRKEDQLFYHRLSSKKTEVKFFFKKNCNLSKYHCFHWRKSPPCMQLENEYTLIEPAFHAKGPPYVRWAANMAVGLQTGVPWVMCRQDDAPDPVVSLLLDPSKAYVSFCWTNNKSCNLQINTCNGMRCGETFAGPNSPNKPALWTENWTSLYVLINFHNHNQFFHWTSKMRISKLDRKEKSQVWYAFLWSYQTYGGETYLRSAEDIAFYAALFIAKKGSYVNYYMVW